MRRWLLLVAVFSGLTAFSGAAQASGRIYLLRGFLGVFSTGLNTLGDQLTKRGYDAKVASYGDYSSLAVEAAHLEKIGRRPIIIIGHSLGANAAILMARAMKAKGARVALVVCFGPTEKLRAPSNVRRVINYYGHGMVVVRGPGFRGSIHNINIDPISGVNHFNVEKIRRFHRHVIATIETITRRNRLARSRPAEKKTIRFRKRVQADRNRVNATRH